MQNIEIKRILETAADDLPACHEKVVILAMLGNLFAGVSNQPLSDKACECSRQILADLRA